MDRKDAVVDAGVADALHSLRGIKPQISGPHLDAKLTAKKDRRGSSATTQVEHAHPWTQVQRGRQPFGQPE